jgi:hypothetical protein
MADLRNRGFFGKSYTTKDCNHVATRIKLDCPKGKRHSSVGRQRSGITQLVSAPADVPAAEVQQASWHKSTAMSACYQPGNEQSYAKRYKAMFIPHPIKKKKRKKPTPTMAQLPMMAQPGPADDVCRQCGYDLIIQ